MRCWKVSLAFVVFCSVITAVAANVYAVFPHTKCVVSDTSSCYDAPMDGKYSNTCLSKDQDQCSGFGWSCHEIDEEVSEVCVSEPNSECGEGSSPPTTACGKKQKQECRWDPFNEYCAVGNYIDVDEPCMIGSCSL